MGPQLERLPDDHPRSRDVRVRLSPRSQVFFRPEEVERGSERVAGPPLTSSRWVGSLRAVTNSWVGNGRT